MMGCVVRIPEYIYCILFFSPVEKVPRGHVLDRWERIDAVIIDRSGRGRLGSLKYVRDC